MKNKIILFFSIFLGLYFSACSQKNILFSERTITVSGTGSVYYIPDQASLTMTVNTSNKDIQTAVEENSQKMITVQKALKNMGIPQTNILTAHYTVNRDSSWKNGKHIQGNYTVGNKITITITDLSKCGKIIDEGIKAGANEFSSLSFSISNRNSLLKQAKIQAIKKAEEDANLLANTAGTELGKVVTIKEVDPSVFNSSNIQLKTTMLKSSDTPISAGKQELSVTVNITYALQ